MYMNATQLKKPPVSVQPIHSECRHQKRKRVVRAASATSSASCSASAVLWLGRSCCTSRTLRALCPYSQAP